MAADHLAHEVVLALAVGEELHRLDVGVAVDHAPGEGRVRLGERGGLLAYRRHHEIDHRAVGEHPGQHRQQQAPVDPGEEKERAEEVDQQEPDAVQHVDHGIAQGLAGLQHLLRNAPGEVVLEVGEALAKHVAVIQPAHPIGQPRDQAEVDQAAGGQGGDRTQDHRHEGHGEKAPTVVRHEGFGGARGQPVDQCAEKSIERQFGDRGDAGDGQGQNQQAFDGGQEVDEEGPGAGRRAFDRGRSQRIEEAFEESIHARGGSPELFFKRCSLASPADPIPALARSAFGHNVRRGGGSAMEGQRSAKDHSSFCGADPCELGNPARVLSSPDGPHELHYCGAGR